MKSSKKSKSKRSRKSIGAHRSLGGLVESSSVVGNKSYFEALDNSDKARRPIPIRALYQWIQLIQVDRVLMGALARYLFDNSGAAAYLVRQIKNYSVPCIPQASTADAAYNKTAEAIWKDFTRSSDFYGIGNFYDQQSLISYSLDLEGEIGSAVIEDQDLIQLQLVHSSYICRKGDHENTVDGIQYDSSGRVVNYWINQKDGKEIPVSPSQFKLIFDQEDYRVFRGMSPLRRGSNELRDARDILDFEKKGVKFASSIAAAMKTPTGGVEEDDWGGDSENVSDEDKALLSKFQKGIGLAEMVGGEIPILPEGYSLDQIDFNRPSSTFGGFLDCLFGMFAHGLDIPAAFFLDSKLTGPNQRSVIGKAQKKFDSRKQTICDWTTWVWARVMAHAHEKGEIQLIEKWDEPVYQSPAKASIDLGRQAQQDREDLKALLMSRRAIFGNRGEDWDTEIDQIFTEEDKILTKIEELSKKHSTIPLETLLKRYGFDSATQSQQQT